MHLRNSFPDYSWAKFMDAWKCWYCEMNTADCLHHIMGRGSGDSKVESSIFNAAPLCNHKCHLPNHGKIRTNEYSKIFLQKTFDYLINIEYELEEIDRGFIKKYETFYRRDQLTRARKSINEQDLQGDALDNKKPIERSIPLKSTTIPKPRKVRRK